MAEKIIVKNFSVLKDVELEVNKFNILIGEQASGKSLIIRLIYYFKYVVNITASAIHENAKVKPTEKYLSDLFFELFPQNFYAGNFSLEYRYEFLMLRITQQSKNKLKLKFSPKAYGTVLSEITKKIGKKKIKKGADYNEIYAGVSSFFHGKNEYLSVIPEMRAALLQQGTAAHIPQTQKHIAETHLLQLEDAKQNHKGKNFTYPDPQSFFYDILKGEINLKKGKLFIKAENETDIDNLSSGQKAAMPLLLVLADIFDMLSESKEEYDDFVLIEEPEMQISPKGQKDMAELLALVQNLSGQRICLFLTSRSQYFLSSINNLIQAYNSEKALEKKIKEDKIPEDRYRTLAEKLGELVDSDLRLNIENFSAFCLKDGELSKLIDTENRLITADYLDDTANAIADKFGNLLDIEYGV